MGGATDLMMSRRQVGTLVAEKLQTLANLPRAEIEMLDARAESRYVTEQAWITLVACSRGKDSPVARPAVEILAATNAGMYALVRAQRHGAQKS